MSSPVFGITLRTSHRESLGNKLKRLFAALAPGELVEKGALWAVKLHFGEEGCSAFIRPHLVRVFVDELKALKGKPFLVDSNTLYIGQRGNAVDHLQTAVLNGFDYAVVGAPLIIADGLRGQNITEVPVGRTIKTAYIASDIVHADGLLTLSHLKGHELTGFGGALKNLAMGGAARRGKMAQHSDLSPQIITKRCAGCRRCLDKCASGAISLNSNKKAEIDPKKCVGCAYCIPICPEGAIRDSGGTSGHEFMKRMAEYALATVTGKKSRALYVNFVTGVSPVCDCYPNSDAPIVPDLGILAGHDPVALDLASAELVNQARGLPGTALKTALEPGQDKWRALHPSCDWPFLLQYAEEIGLGSREYALTWLPEKL